MSEDFFTHIDFESFKPKAGKILISDPFLIDTYFKRTVIYLVEHNKEGSVGFILNKSVNLNLNDVISNFPTVNTEVFFGGPVNQNNLFYIHTYGGLISDSRHIKDGLYWGGSFEQMKHLFETNQIDTDNIRFFAGYSGWTKGQLKRELEEKTWIVSDVSTEQLFTGKSKNFWNDVLRKMGKKYEIMSNFPEDPTLN